MTDILNEDRAALSALDDVDTCGHGDDVPRWLRQNIGSVTNKVGRLRKQLAATEADLERVRESLAESQRRNVEYEALLNQTLMHLEAIKHQQDQQHRSTSVGGDTQPSPVDADKHSDTQEQAAT